MRTAGMKRWIGFLALAAFVAQGAGGLAPPSDLGFFAAGNLWQLPILAPDLPMGEVPPMVEVDRLDEAPVAVRDAPLPEALSSRGPPA